MKTQCRSLMAAVVVSAALSACATSTDKAKQPTLEERLGERGYALGGPVERINDYRIAGYQTLDEENLILDAGVSRYYLIALNRPCTGVTATDNIGFTTTASTLTRFDRLEFQQPGTPQTCQIEEIRELQRVKRSD
jgi:hypothetical protein